MAKKTEKAKTKTSSKPVPAPKVDKKKSNVKPVKVEVKSEKITKSSQAEKAVKAAPAAKSVQPVKTKTSGEEKAKKSSEQVVDTAGADPIWLELHRKHGDEKTQNYDMRGVFETSTALNHKILGWGWILSNENDRLEVVFKDGKRVLISNYKK